MWSICPPWLDLKNKTNQPFLFFPCFKTEDASHAWFKTKSSNNYFSQRNGLFYFPVIFSFTFSRRSTQIPTPVLCYTMAPPTLKWPLRIGDPKTTGDTPMSSDNEDPHPHPNPTPTPTPTFFTIKRCKWLLQYQKLFQFYLVHGHTNVTRRNADNYLAEWASVFYRSLLVINPSHRPNRKVCF
jgi:hypothetical protein